MANGLLKRVAQQQAHAHSSDNTAGGVKKATRSNKEPADALWNFSLRYWVQLDWFGLHGKGIDNQWLVSVLERLKQLPSEPIERVYRDGVMRDAMRYHPINWQATNIPIAKTEIPGLPSYCIDNPEFELHQFQISKGKGRVVGFFDEIWVFNIVLLDPLHNLQPSKSFGYAVDPCQPLSCEITSLREGIRESISDCAVVGCHAREKVAALVDGHEKHLDQFEILMLKLKDQSLLQWANDLVAKGQVGSLAEIFETGLLTVADKPPSGD